MRKGNTVNLSDFKIGDLVIVNPNTKDLDLGIDIGGWQGRVKEISERYDSIIVAWDSLTLKQMPGEAIDKCEEDGLDWRTYGLSPQDVALTSPRDHADDAEDAIRLLESKHGWSYLGEEGKRIQAALAKVDSDDKWAAFEAWDAYFKQTLTFPFEAEVSEWQDRGPLRTGEKVRFRYVSIALRQIGAEFSVESAVLERFRRTAIKYSKRTDEFIA
jgi:hypothetical protein